jgi:uncharacterized repeat protein (TIGR03806 family)
MRNFFSIVSLFLISFMSCSDSDTYEKITPEVSVDLSKVPYPKLSDYHFFKDELKNLSPNNRVLPYQPASELFTDYASKSRFVWMPQGTKANLNHPHQIADLPVGAVLIKNFYYQNLMPNNHRQVIETRLLINTSNGWQPYTYVWNDAQTDAFLNEEEQTLPLNWQKSPTETIQINYVIPSQTSCFSCHHTNFVDSDEIAPIGIKPHHLNHTYNYADGPKNQWQKWQEVGYLNPPSITFGESAINYKSTTEDLTKRVRSYLDINCAHCHRVGAEAELLPIKFSFHLTANNDGLGICDDRILPPTNSVFFGQHYILPNQPELSLIYHKMTINTAGLLMPPIGRSINDQEAVNLMQQWILSLPDCP